MQYHFHLAVRLGYFLDFRCAFPGHEQPRGEDDAGNSSPQLRTVRFHPGKEKETTDKYQKHNQRDKTASVEMDDLLCSHEIAVNQKRSHVDAETGD